MVYRKFLILDCPWLLGYVKQEPALRGFTRESVLRGLRPVLDPEALDAFEFSEVVAHENQAP